MVKLDVRDYKILRELDKDSKASYHQIGRKLRLSPSVVERRVKSLLQDGVIRDFKSIINYKKLGWTYYSIYTRLQNITEQKRKEMLDYLIKHPLVGQVLLCDGRWQFVYGFFARDVFNLMDELKEFHNLFGSYILESQKIIHTGSHHYYRGYLVSKEEFRQEEPYLGGPENSQKIDAEEIKILNALRNDARVNIVSLAEQLGLTIDQTRYRIKKLTHEGIINGSWLHLNPNKLGLNFYRILLNVKNMDKTVERDFYNFLNKHKHVIRANRAFGSWDYFTDLEISTNDFREFMTLFTKTFNDQIQGYETLMIYDEVNYTFSPIFPIK